MRSTVIWLCVVVSVTLGATEALAALLAEPLAPFDELELAVDPAHPARASTTAITHASNAARDAFANDFMADSFPLFGEARSDSLVRHFLT